MSVSRLHPDIHQRLRDKTVRTDDGHWLFTGGKRVSGHGAIWFEGRVVSVSRVAAHLYLGLDLTSDLCALHKTTCPHKNCWNPECLYVGTKKDNTQDMITVGVFKGWGND